MKIFRLGKQRAQTKEEEATKGAGQEGAMRKFVQNILYMCMKISLFNIIP